MEEEGKETLRTLSRTTSMITRNNILFFQIPKSIVTAKKKDKKVHLTINGL